VQKDKPILIPDEILAAYLSQDEITAYKKSDTRITSITVYAEKPAETPASCCAPGNGCC
jgi:hypothetical protein